MFTNRLSIIISIGLGIALIAAFSPLSSSDNEKITGTSLEAPRNAFNADNLAPIVSIASEWVAIIPYAYSTPGSPNVTFNYSRQYWGERSEGVKTSIDHARSLGLKVMIKPHIWVRGQGWPGDFTLNSEQDWLTWEEDYTDYILTFAEIAEEKDVELFSIATEYRHLVSEKPEVWRRIIKKIKQVYSGQLTYAANWDNYESVTFWDEIDYIGIDAYFPLAESKNPSVEEINTSWQPTKDKLKAFSEQWDRPILFTEYGYQSVDYAAAGHWKHNQDTLSVNQLAQANAYESLYQTFWNEEWFKGGFLWKWHLNTNFRRNRQSNRRYSYDKRFTPQGKIAEEVIKKWYSTE